VHSLDLTNVIYEVKKKKGIKFKRLVILSHGS